MTVVPPQLRLQPVPAEAVDEQHDTLRAVTQLLEERGLERRPRPAFGDAEQTADGGGKVGDGTFFVARYDERFGQERG